jgi:hypothetical protein
MANWSSISGESHPPEAQQSSFIVTLQLIAITHQKYLESSATCNHDFLKVGRVDRLWVSIFRASEITMSDFLDLLF